MVNGTPLGTVGAAYSSGWMTADNFFSYLKHFVNSVKCSPDRPALLIMDNHESHLSIDTIDSANENGVQILTLPPH